MSMIATVIILAVTVEALIEYGKLIFVDKSINWKQVGALALGVALAVLAQVDLFSIIGVTFLLPYAGMVLTGIIFSRGANYAADFIKLIQGVTAKQQDPMPDGGGDPEEDDTEPEDGEGGEG